VTAIRLVQTCGACPEQYDALDEHGRIVGYLRLRHGYFSVEMAGEHGYGPEVYSAQPIGDGVFDVDERQRYLDIAVVKIAEHLDGPAVPDAARSAQAAQAIAVALEEAAISDWDAGDGKVIEIYLSQIAPIVERVLKQGDQ